ncbi:hypothetical protein DL98DRAFT_596312 [Cadophora sp. DSE1049]|nr:hypothetical protein DL98DRAFT_596312 [Cadophora sp. DSE1049]
MEGVQYPVMKGEKEFARRRDIKRRLRIIEQEEQERANVSKGKRKARIENEDEESPSKKASVDSDDGLDSCTDTNFDKIGPESNDIQEESSTSPPPLPSQSGVPFIPIPVIPDFHYGTQTSPSYLTEVNNINNNNRSLILRLYGASAPPQPVTSPHTPPRPLTRIPTTPPPSNRPEPHAPPSGSPFLPPDAVRDTTTRRFPCAWINCNKNYSTIERANRHIKTTHIKGRNWVCQQCGHFAAKEEEKLTDHLRKTGHKDDRWPGFEFWGWV